MAFRTWRLIFEADERIVRVLEIRSGYTAEELLSEAPDPYGDKAPHRAYLAAFPGRP